MQAIKILVGIIVTIAVLVNLGIAIFFFSMSKGEKEKFKKPPKKWWMFWRKR